jgi:hypothetical protein
MGRVINLGRNGLLNLNEGVVAPINLELPDANGMQIIVFYPKKYVTEHEGSYAVDYEKIQKDGFNTVLKFEKLGERNNIIVEPNEEDNSFKVIIREFK